MTRYVAKKGSYGRLEQVRKERIIIYIIILKNKNKDECQWHIIKLDDKLKRKEFNKNIVWGKKCSGFAHCKYVKMENNLTLYILLKPWD